ncbi:hypothetical protein BO99DRAFT_433807 [Aspergillus violaceofuscus CBS 115571]|uniref:Uncharacterized protein n=1 Tax=Aspergillus violaceofuscus (strain CBS 115571) TaxID=1450538 RepID=A0A2V5H3N7_ASPV1|nr:hypothetical protein BO99DRAFT_433807 [Aspergillus violaceofuscus CBS 115571]
MEHLPFIVLVNLMITGTENPEAAVGLIEHVKLYLGYGLPLNEETNMPQRPIYQMSHGSSFFIYALLHAKRIDELQRLLPVFGLLLLHGGDPRTRFGLKLYESGNRRRLGHLIRRKDLCTDAIQLSIKNEIGWHVIPMRRRAGTLSQLREELGESFTLSQLLEHLFPFGKGAIVCEMAKWHLTLPGDLSAAEVAEMRRQRFESKVEEQLLTRDAIKKCFEGKDID